ncbi:MAG: hypothetical protein IJU26_07565 [Synergistaceae bacterium]|nr:hypothetical protein [Synergistaceae bacterium]
MKRGLLFMACFEKYNPFRIRKDKDMLGMMNLSIINHRNGTKLVHVSVQQLRKYFML